MFPGIIERQVIGINALCCWILCPLNLCHTVSYCLCPLADSSTSGIVASLVFESYCIEFQPLTFLIKVPDGLPQSLQTNVGLVPWSRHRQLPHVTRTSPHYIPLQRTTKFGEPSLNSSVSSSHDALHWHLQFVFALCRFSSFDLHSTCCSPSDKFSTRSIFTPDCPYSINRTLLFSLLLLIAIG